MALASLRRTLIVALASLALAPPAALARSVDQPAPAARHSAAQDLRSPDTRDAATRYQPSLPGPTSNDGRAVAQERYYSSYGHSPQPARAGASGDGIAPLPFVLAIAGALIVGLLGGSGLHTVRTRRRHAAGLAT